MAGKEGETVVDPKTLAGEGGEKVTPPAAKVEPPAKDPKETPPAVTKDGANKAAGEKPPAGGLKRVQISTDDDIPEDAELLELSKTALNSRLKRATAKELRERFGTDDTAEIKKKLDRLTALEADEDKRKREAMSERERLEADLTAARAEKDELSRQLRIERNERVVHQEDQRIAKIANKYIENDEDTTEV